MYGVSIGILVLASWQRKQPQGIDYRCRYTMGTHGSFPHFRGYNLFHPYFGGLKPFMFHVFFGV